MILLTPIKRYMMERILQFNGAITKEQLTEARGTTTDRLQDLLDAGYIEVVPHIKETDPVTNRPRDALAITALGRDILALDGRD